MWTSLKVPSTSLLLLLSFQYLAYAAVELKESATHQYQLYVGAYPGSHGDVPKIAKQAYEEMIKIGGKASMMACTHIDGTIYCASSSTGRRPKPFPQDFEKQTKDILKQCEGNKNHQSKAGCAETMLLNELIIKTGSAQRYAEIHAYGTGAGKDPKPMKACMGKDGQFGCQELLRFLDWIGARELAQVGTSGGGGAPGPSNSGAETGGKKGGKRRSLDFLKAREFEDDLDFLYAREYDYQPSFIYARENDYQPNFLSIREMDDVSSFLKARDFASPGMVFPVDKRDEESYLVHRRSGADLDDLRELVRREVGEYLSMIARDAQNMDLDF